MSEIEQMSDDYSLDMTADIVAAYVSNNSVPISELPALIASVNASLTGLGKSASPEFSGPEKATPAQIRKSISPDGIVSFEDGKTYKSLKRHLKSRGLTPETYRAKHGLPADYPMVSAAYSAQRSELARALGLGQQRRKSHLKAVPAVAVVAETISDAPKTRGRPPKAAPKARASKKSAETA